MDFWAFPEPGWAEYADGEPLWGGIAENEPAEEIICMDTWQMELEPDVNPISATGGGQTSSATVIIFEVVIKDPGEEADPPSVVPVGEEVQLKGVAVPHVPGDYEWWKVGNRIELTGADQQTVTVRGLQVSGAVNDVSI